MISDRPAPESGGRGRPTTWRRPLLPGYTRTTVLRASASSTLVSAVAPDGRPVMLKIADGAGAERLRTEHAILRDLAGVTGVGRALGIERHGAETVLVLEWVGGADLRSQLDGLELEPALDFAVQLTRIVRDIHRHGVVHRDLKPSNVMVTDPADRLCLIDFGLSSSRAHPRPGRHFEGTAAYMAPEQSGRMNREVDARADLYALGVVFFELFTGRLPFERDALSDFVHAHLATRPPRVDAIAPGVPRVLADIVARLLRKEPDRRYQSAGALLADLERVQANFAAGGSIERFALGAAEGVRRLPVTDRLFGREAVVDALTERLAAPTDRPRLLLLCGEAGVGKSAVVHVVRRRVLTGDGALVGGKFEQFRTAQPFSAFARAFDQLADHVLGVPDDALAAWRGALVAELGGVAAALTSLSPRFTAVLGAVTPLPAARPDEARNRVRLAVTRALQVARRMTRGPLVLFLDDVQWADAGSLWLIEALLGACAGLTVLATARPADPAPWAPLLTALDAAGRPAWTETLTPLGDADFDALVAELTGRDVEYARGLARLVADRCENNPLLARQFLTFLIEAGLIRLHVDGGWTWSLEEVAAAGLPETLAETLAARIDRLPASLVEVLGAAACVGTLFDPAVVAAQVELEPVAVHRALTTLADQGLLVAGPEGWQFAHDRIQEAAYARLPPEQRARLHRRIGRHLLAAAGAELDRHLFAIVDQLDRGEPADDPIGLAELNLRAGRRAIEQGDWRAAADYLDAGAALVDGAEGEREATLRFDLAFERAQSALLLGDFDDAERRVQGLLRDARDPLTRMQVLARQVILLAGRNRFDEAMTAGLAALAEAGVDIPRHPSRAHARQVFERARQLTAPDALGRFAELPPVTDEMSRQVLDLMPQLASAAFALDKALLTTVLSQNLIEAATRGHTPWLALTLGHFGFTLVAWDHFDHGLAVHDMAWRIAHDLSPRELARTSYVVGLFGRPWVWPWADCAAYLHPALAAAIDTGDVEFAVLQATAGHSLRFFGGDDLTTLYHDAERDHATLEPFFAGLPRVLHLGFARLVSGQLRGALPMPARDPFGFDGWPGGVPHYVVRNTLPLAAATLCVFGRFEEVAVEFDRLPGELGEQYFGVAYEVLLRFCLAFAALCLDRGREPGRQVQRWIVPYARRNPANFQQLAALLDAELARVDGRDADAADHYAHAAEAARRHGDRMVLGIVEERRAAHATRRGLTGDARTHLRAALATYAAWGARAKVDALLAAHPALADLPRRDGLGLDESTAQLSTPSIEDVGRQLDVTTVWNVVRRLSDDLRLEAVARVVLDAALVNAGATYGLLVLAEDGGVLRAVAERADGGEHRPLDAPLSALEHAPQRLVRLVARTGESVVLARAGDVDRYDDPRLAAAPDLSVLCVPLLDRDGLVGVLYLENRLVSGAFHRERVQVMQLLGLQAAISLTNARLHEATERLARTLEARVRERTEELRVARDEALEATRAKSAFLATMSHEIRTPMNGLMGMAQLLADTPLDAQQHDYAETIVRSADALLTVLNDILDFSKIEAEQLTIESIPFSVRDVVDGVGQLIASGADQKDLGFTVRVEPHVTDQRIGDPTRLRQVLLNLTNNALKFTERGRIELCARPGDAPHAVRFEVRDTGIGIPPERLDRLFRAFSQVDDSTNRRFGGTGLGLAICKRLVELMGGRIDVESRPGRGSTFSIDVPLALDPQGDAAPLPGVATLPIAIIEDDDAHAAAIDAALRGLGAAALTRTTLDRLDPATRLVLVGLPRPAAELDALDPLAATGVRAHLVAAPRHRSEAQRHTARPGVAGWLARPVRSERLRATLADVLDATPRPRAARDATTPPRRSARVLVAEDNPVNQKIARWMVERAGHTCVVVHDGLQALEAIDHGHFDLILMDCQMPVMDGFEATRRLRARGCALPIVALTAGALDEERDACLAAGMNAFVAKPVRFTSLVAALDAQLGDASHG